MKINRLSAVALTGLLFSSSSVMAAERPKTPGTRSQRLQQVISARVGNDASAADILVGLGRCGNLHITAQPAAQAGAAGSEVLVSCASADNSKQLHINYLLLRREKFEIKDDGANILTDTINKGRAVSKIEFKMALRSVQIKSAAAHALSTANPKPF